MAKPAVPIKFIDLFAGLGGFHVAMERLGGECVFAAEWEPGLQDLYEDNFGLRPHGDITKVKLDEIPDHDVLCAGFPCQPFSKAGEQLGFEHTEQGRLFFDVLEILKKRKPSCFILENVPNLLKHDEGRTFQRIMGELVDAGYTVDFHRLSPHHFAIPQVRERVYIVGSINGFSNFVWPEKSTEATSIHSVLGCGTGKPLSKRVESVLETWDEFIRAIPAETAIPSFPIWAMEFGATYPYENESPHIQLLENPYEGLDGYKGSFGVELNGTAEQKLSLLPSHARRPGNEFPRWKKTFIRQNREFYQQNRTWIDPWLPKLLDFPSSFQKLEWNSQGEERTIWKSVVQMRASGVRVKRPTTAPSLIAMTDSQVPIIAWEKRYMTPEECARLQSLEEIVLPSAPGRAFKALGNAVNARVVEAILARLIEAVKSDATDVSVADPEITEAA